MVDTNRKWIIRLGNREQGPFSLEELRQKLAGGEASAHDKVRASDSQTWMKLQEAIAAQHAGPQNPDDLSVFIEMKSLNAEDRTMTMDPSTLRRVKREAAKVTKVAEVAQRKFDAVEVEERPSRKLLWVVVGALVVGGGVAAWKFPNVFTSLTTTLTDSLFSPIPSIADVSKEDYARLKAAAGTDVKKDGPRVALALSTGAPNEAVVYVSTNLPEGSVIDLVVKGVPGTLVGARSFERTLYVEVGKKLVRTRPIMQAVGAQLPRGYYEIHAVPAEKQPPAAEAIIGKGQTPAKAKARTSIRVFLGGAPDTTYQQQLNAEQRAVAEEKAKIAQELQFLAAANARLLQELKGTMAQWRMARNKGAKDRALTGFEKAWLRDGVELDGKVQNVGTLLNGKDAALVAVGDAARKSLDSLKRAKLALADVRDVRQMEQALTGAEVGYAELKARVDALEKEAR